MVDFILKNVPILVTSLLTAYLAHFFTVRKIKLQRQNKAKFVASNLAFKLEKFAVEVAKDNQLVKVQNNSNGMLGDPMFRIPELGKVENFEELEALPNDLFNAVMEIIAEVDYSQSDANFWGFVEGEFSKDESLEVHSNRLALKALNTADRLRRHFNGNPRPLVFHKWDARKAINELK